MLSQATDRGGMTLEKRIQRLESRIAARGGPRRHIFLWLNEGDDPKDVQAEALSSGRITERDRVLFSRWFTEEEAAKLGAW